LQFQNRNDIYKVFVARYLAIIDHHFGDCACCQGRKAGWYKYKGNEGMI